VGKTRIVFELSGEKDPYGSVSWGAPGRLSVMFSSLRNFQQMIHAAETTKATGLVKAIRPGERRLESGDECSGPPWATIDFDVDHEVCSNIEVEFSPPGVSPKRLTIVLEQGDLPRIGGP